MCECSKCGKCDEVGECDEVGTKVYVMNIMNYVNVLKVVQHVHVMMEDMSWVNALNMLTMVNLKVSPGMRPCTTCPHSLRPSCCNRLYSVIFGALKAETRSRKTHRKPDDQTTVSIVGVVHTTTLIWKNEVLIYKDA